MKKILIVIAGIVLLLFTACMPMGYTTQNNLIVPDKTKTRSNTIIIAANDSTVNSKAQADIVCNGIDDDIDINSAIDTVLAAGGGTVKLLEGTFSIGSMVLLKSYVNLSGNGWATIIKLENEATFTHAGMLRAVGGNSYITVSDLAVDGNKGNQADGTNKYGFYCGEAGLASTNITLSNVYVHDMSRYGIDPHELSDYISIVNCTVANCGNAANPVYDGITTDYCQYIKVSGCTIYGNYRYGINIVTSSKYNLYSNNVIYNNGSHGININGASDCIVSNNVIKGNGANGIYLSSSPNCTINNNYIGLNQQHGIKTYKTSYNTISSNILHNNSQQTHSGYSEIILDDDGATFSTYINVIGNNVICNAANRAKYGIREDAAGDNYNSITGNVITGANTTNLSMQGVNSVSVGNIN